MKIRKKSKILRNLSRTIGGITKHVSPVAPEEEEKIAAAAAPSSAPKPASAAKRPPLRGKRRRGLLRTLSTTIGLAPSAPPAPEPVEEETVAAEETVTSAVAPVTDVPEDGAEEADTQPLSESLTDDEPSAPEETQGSILQEKQPAPAKEAAKREDLPVGTILGGQYRIIKILGKGGMGVVYEAYHSSLDRYVALKVLPVDLMTPEYVERFRIEAAAAARLEHPNIVPIHTIAESDGLHYFVMAFVKGRTLEDIIDERSSSPVKTRRFLPEAEVMDITLQVASALDFAHANGVVHGDIKPANIMIDPGGKCVVTDFGLAAVASYHTKSQDGVLGSPLYMPPERARGETGDNRCDIYSLGAVLYEMLTGNCAFDSESVDAVLRDVVAGNIVPPTVRRPSLSPVLEAIVLKAMSLRPRERYQTIDSFVADIQRYKEGVSISVPIAPVPGSTINIDKVKKSKVSQKIKSRKAPASASSGGTLTVGKLLFYMIFCAVVGAALYFHYMVEDLRDRIQMRTERDIAFRFTVADTFKSIKEFKLARKMYSDIAEEYPDAGLHDRVLENVKILNQEEMNESKSDKLLGQAGKQQVKKKSFDSDDDKDSDFEKARRKRILESARKQARNYRRRNLPERADAVFVRIVRRYPGTEIAKTAKEEVESQTDRIFERAFEKVGKFISAGNYESARQVYEKIAIDYHGTTISEKANKELYDLVDQQISLLEMENYRLKKNQR